MKRFINLINGILPFFAVLVLQVILMEVMALMYITVMRILVQLDRNTVGITDPAEIITAAEERSWITPGLNNLFGLIATAVIGIIFFLWYRKICRDNAGHSDGKPSGINLFTTQGIISLILLGLGAQLLVSDILSLLQPLFTEAFDAYNKTVEHILGGYPVVVILYAVIGAPVVEELIFRGVMLRKLRLALPGLGANLLQAAIFGIYHWNLIQGIYAFTLGLLFGYICIRFRSVLASILLHVVINGSAFLLMLIPGENNPWMMLILGMAGAGCIVISFFLLRKQENKYLI